MQFREIYEDNRVSGIAEGFLYATFTDRIIIKKWPLSDSEKAEIEQNFEKLLECRIFNEDCEHRCIRSTIGREFKVRFATEDDSKYQDYYDEKQYLDIDTKKSRAGENGTTRVVTTGGGAYDFPLSAKDYTKVIIRNYVDYYLRSGQGFVFDWRIVGFE